MGRYRSLAGMRFGRLLVVADVGRLNSNVVWRCLCDCGAEKEIRSHALVRGYTVSCGCFYREQASKINRTHGLTETLEYGKWCGMKGRCRNRRNKRYRFYGARGIKVCDRWRDSFENFLADMGPCPPGLTLERIDVDGDYAPGNCRWATWAEQHANTRRVVRMTLNGETMSLAELARRVKIDRRTIQKRLRLGWTLERAIAVAGRWPAPSV